jgi:hypothetical protein
VKRHTKRHFNNSTALASLQGLFRTANENPEQPTVRWFPIGPRKRIQSSDLFRVVNERIIANALTELRMGIEKSASGN